MEKAYAAYDEMIGQNKRITFNLDNDDGPEGRFNNAMGWWVEYYAKAAYEKEFRFWQVASIISAEWTPRKSLKVKIRRLSLPYIERVKERDFLTETEIYEDESFDLEFDRNDSLKLQEGHGFFFKDSYENRHSTVLLFTGPSEIEILLVVISRKTQKLIAVNKQRFSEAKNFARNASFADFLDKPEYELSHMLMPHNTGSGENEPRFGSTKRDLAILRTVTPMKDISSGLVRDW